MFKRSVIRRPRRQSSRLPFSFFILTLLLGCLLSLNVAEIFAQEKSSIPGQTTPRESARSPQTFTREGVSVEFEVEPLAPRSGTSKDPLAGTEATVRFKITDANGGRALSSLRPAAWIDSRHAGQTATDKECREKVQSFLQPGFNKRPGIDLNAYFILALNHEPNISVIDPLSGFGGSKLYTLISLLSPGEDWAISADRKRLYVSMPLANKVAVIDTASWTVSANVDAGALPTRIALQNDGKYLWVGNNGAEESDSGVTVFDTTTLKVAARFTTGAGHHEIAFTDDDQFTFVTNKQAGTLSVIDVRRLASVKSFSVGTLPVSMAFSTLSKALYVANEGDGTIVEIDGLRHEILGRMKTQPGLRALRIPSEGRFGFVANRLTNSVNIFDLSARRLVHDLPVGPAPDQISFTRQFAYVRSAGSEFVTMIKITELEREAPISRFPAGQKAPMSSPATSSADTIVPAPEDGAVLVANPADKMIYFYSEGMAAPMGSFQNYRRDPKAVLVLNNNLRESAPGIYSTTVRLTGAGSYDVAFLLDSPRVVNCFTLIVAENPSLPKQKGVPFKIEPLATNKIALAGESQELRFKVTDTSSNLPNAGLKDLGVLLVLAPGTWQQRELAQPLADGVYGVTFVPPQAGVYYVYFQCPSLGVRFNQIPHLNLQVTRESDAVKRTPAKQ